MSKCSSDVRAPSDRYKDQNHHQRMSSNKGRLLSLRLKSCTWTQHKDFSWGPTRSHYVEGNISTYQQLEDVCVCYWDSGLKIQLFWWSPKSQQQAPSLILLFHRFSWQSVFWGKPWCFPNHNHSGVQSRGWVQCCDKREIYLKRKNSSETFSLNALCGFVITYLANIYSGWKRDLWVNSSFAMIVHVPSVTRRSAKHRLYDLTTVMTLFKINR